MLPRDRLTSVPAGLLDSDARKDWESPVAVAVRHLARVTVLVAAKLIALAFLIVIVFAAGDALGLSGVASGLVVLVALGFVLIPRRSRSRPTR